MIFVWLLVGMVWAATGIFAAIAYRAAVYEARVWPSKTRVVLGITLAYITGPVSIIIALLWLKSVNDFMEEFEENAA